MTTAIKTYTYIFKYILSLLLKQEWQLKVKLLIAILCTATAITLDIFLPITLKQIVAFGDMKSKGEIYFLILLISYCIMWVINRIIFSVREIFIVRVVERSVRNLSHDFFTHLYNLPMSFHVNKKIGDITNIIEKASSALPTIIYGLLFFLIPTIIEIMIALVLFFKFYGVWYAALLALIFLLFIMFSVRASSDRTMYRRESNKIHGQVASHITDVLLNFETVSYFGAQQRELEEYDNLLRKKEDAQAKSYLLFETLYLGNSIIIGFGFTIFTMLFGREILIGTKGVGDLMLIHCFLIQFFVPLGAFGIIMRDAYRSCTDMERVITILNMQPIFDNFHPAILPKKNSGTIEFKNVTFAYENNAPILKNVSFKIPAGAMIGIIGPTGSGKSTIIKLLYRFYDVINGEILIDGENIKNISRTAITQMFGIVPQDPFLFNNSIAYNICYGYPSASTNEIINAAQRAQIHTSIKSLPQQYETVVGEQGAKLSRGERQRIALARLFLKNPSVYVFDEATASIDENTQSKIIDKLYELCAEKTTLIVTHQPSKLEGINYWLQLENGKITEKFS